MPRHGPEYDVLLEPVSPSNDARADRVQPQIEEGQHADSGTRRAHRAIFGYTLDVVVLCVAIGATPSCWYYVASATCSTCGASQHIWSEQQEADAMLGENETTLPIDDDCIHTNAAVMLVSDWLAASPAYLRAALVMPLWMVAEKCVGSVTGTATNTNFWFRLCFGDDQALRQSGEMTRNHAAGWNGIVGHDMLSAIGGDSGSLSQSTWEQVVADSNLNPRRAGVSAALRLVLWHWCQPFAYCIIFWQLFCGMSPFQQLVGSVVAGRELVYWASSIVAARACPVFLLLNPHVVWRETNDAAQKWTRLLCYVLIPHNYTIFCLAYRYPRHARMFVTLAVFEVFADIASCVALFELLLRRAAAIATGDEFQEGMLLVGYCITATGFLMFWIPVFVVRMYRRAVASTNNQRQWVEAVAKGCLAAIGCVYAISAYVALLLGSDVLCSGFIPFSQPNCNGVHVLSTEHGPAGVCHSGYCQCTTWRDGDSCSLFKPQRLQGQENTIYQVAFSPPGTPLLLASAGYERSIRLWSPRQSESESWGLSQELIGDHERLSLCVAFAPSGDLLAAGSVDHTIWLWARDNNGRWAEVQSLSPGGMRLTVRAVAFSPSGRLLAYTSGYTLGFWERQDNHSWSQTTMIHVHPEAPESGFYAVAFSPVDEHLVATCGSDREISLWAQNAATGNWTRAAVLKGTGASIFNVAFSPEGTVLAAGAEDGTITMWNKELYLGNIRWVQQSSRLTGHTQGVSCVAFSPHGNILASSSFDSTIRFWSRTDQSKAWSEIEMDYKLEHTNYVYTIAFSPLGNFLASGGVDAVVSVWS